MDVKNPVETADEFWSTFAEEYDRTFYNEVNQYPSLVLRHRYILDMFDKPGANILDIGCGPGKMLIDLMKRGCTVTGVDIAQGMLEVARKNIESAFPGSRPSLMVGNIENLELQNGLFDAAICAGVIEYLENDHKSLAELARVLKRGGTLLLSVRNRACPARVIDFLTDIVKSSGAGLKLLNALNRLLRRRSTTEIKYTYYRKHSIAKLKGNLRAAGFEVKDFRYFHFYPFFVPFDKLAPRFFLRQGLKMEALSHTRWGWLGSGYIVKAHRVL